MVVFDKQKQKLVEYRSSKQFNIEILSALVQQDIVFQFKHEIFTNEDYTRFIANDDDKTAFFKDDQDSAGQIEEGYDIENEDLSPGDEKQRQQ